MWFWMVYMIENVFPYNVYLQSSYAGGAVGWSISGGGGRTDSSICDGETWFTVAFLGALGWNSLAGIVPIMISLVAFTDDHPQGTFNC